MNDLHPISERGPLWGASNACPGVGVRVLAKYYDGLWREGEVVEVLKHAEGCDSCMVQFDKRDGEDMTEIEANQDHIIPLSYLEGLSPSSSSRAEATRLLNKRKLAREEEEDEGDDDLLSDGVRGKRPNNVLSCFCICHDVIISW